MTIKNIIFDLGGVILNIETGRTVSALSRLSGYPEPKMLELFYNNRELLSDFEIGKISEDSFRNEVARLMGVKLIREAFDEAWNAILLDIPGGRLETLKKLNSKYRLFLLSNTNSIHARRVDEIANRHAAAGGIFDLFENIYYSFEIQRRKPDTETYRYLLSKERLNPNETLFIDDLEENTEGARKAGLQVLTVKRNQPELEFLHNE